MRRCSYFMAKKIVRKKPKQTRSQEVLTSIYEAAYELLNHPDSKNFTTNRIAKRAGVSIGSLYQYFPNKETILDQILQQIVKMMARDFIEIVHKIPTVEYNTFVENFVKASFEMCLRHPHLMKKTFHIEKSEETIEIIFKSREDVCRELCKIIKEKFKMNNDIEIKVYTMVHAYMGIVEAFVSSKSPYTSEQIQRLYSQILIKMIEI